LKALVTSSVTITPIDTALSVDTWIGSALSRTFDACPASFSLASRSRSRLARYSDISTERTPCDV
jgi:hypothetical protein